MISLEQELPINMRKKSNLDKFIIQTDARIKRLGADPKKTDISPKASLNSHFTSDSNSNLASQKLSAALMRVNHSGEVSAQALYLGQALVARDKELGKAFKLAAQEEKLHLDLCRNRLTELNDKPSLFNPFFAIGSFMIAVVFGLSGDKISLGFLAETENQVVKHLEGHLQRLPKEDIKSREILLKMREDELNHAHAAITKGGVPLHPMIRKLMTLVSKIMTRSAFYI
jgi:ubiquinone biosynthesis monooxygenase Coq7